MNPVSQTVDTWLTLLEKKHLTADREQAFLNLLESFTKGEMPAGADDNTQYSWGQVVLDVRALWIEYRCAKDDEGKLAALRNWLHGQEGYLLKPMNCPHHIQIYKASLRYRDHSVRLAELAPHCSSVEELGA